MKEYPDCSKVCGGGGGGGGGSPLTFCLDIGWADGGWATRCYLCEGQVPLSSAAHFDIVWHILLPSPYLTFPHLHRGGHSQDQKHDYQEQDTEKQLLPREGGREGGREGSHHCNLPYRKKARQDSTTVIYPGISHYHYSLGGRILWAWIVLWIVNKSIMLQYCTTSL